MKNIVKENVVGTIDEIYSSEAGMEIAREGDYTHGWRQLVGNRRIKMLCRRTSHSGFVWEQFEHEANIPS